MGSWMYINEIIKEFRTVIGLDILCSSIYSSKKMDAMLEAYEATKENTESDIYIDLCSQIGRIFAYSDNEQLAIDYFMRGFEVAKKRKDYERQAIIYCYIANAFFRREEYHKALKFFHKERNCYHLLDKNRNDILERNFILCINLGRSYLEIHKVDMSLMYLKVLEEKRFDNIREKYRILINFLKVKTYYTLGEVEQVNIYLNLFIYDVMHINNKFLYFFECKDIYYILVKFNLAKEAEQILERLLNTSDYVISDLYEIIAADAKVKFCKAFRSKEEYILSLKEFKAKLVSQDTMLKEQKRIYNINRQKIRLEQLEKRQQEKQYRQLGRKSKIEGITKPSFKFDIHFDKVRLPEDEETQRISMMKLKNNLVKEGSYRGNMNQGTDFINHLIKFSEEVKYNMETFNRFIDLFYIALQLKEYRLANQLRKQIEKIAMVLNSNSLKLKSCELHIEYCEARQINDFIENLYENYYYLKNKQLQEINMFKINNVTLKMILIQSKEDKRHYHIPISNLPVITG